MRDILGFLGFVCLILFSLFLVWFGLRSYGLNQPVGQYQTHLIQQLIPNEPIQWRESDSKHQWLYTNHTEKSGWMVSSQNEEVLLDKYLTENSRKWLLLFYDLESARALPSLRTIVQKENRWKKIIFCSRQDGSLKDLRDLEPQWTFCSGEVFMTRVLAFSSLGLESLTDISADVLFIHLNQIKPTPTFRTLIKEAKRRKKLVIMGPVARPLDGFSPHGWMLKN